MRVLFIVAYCCASCFLLTGNEHVSNVEIMEMEKTEYPQYLYKIISVQNWQASQNKKTLVLPAEDDAFIHFSTKDQVERIIAKYWPDARQVVILKIDRSKLDGKLVYEANVGGTTKYFHLYQGSIPLNSVVESKILDR